MKAIFDELLKNIPDYKAFLTAREMDESSIDLAKNYPDSVKLLNIGKSRAGSELYCLKIGSDEQKPNALLLGCPHPNEPIGAMMLEYLSLQLAKDEALRDAFGYNCYILKAWDYDGLCMNEGWLKGPFTIEQYAKNMYRPANHLQVDWTFPVKHRDYEFNAVLPETEAVMKLIDEIKPKFIYSLHNAGFGGVYWYISEAMPADVYEKMANSTERQGVPLHMGEPEVPIVLELAPAIYRMGEITELYDFLYENMGPEAAGFLGMGHNSAGYGKGVCGAYSLLTELPFFFDDRISDLTPSSMKKGNCRLINLDIIDECNNEVLSLIEWAEGSISQDNPFYATLLTFIQFENTGAQREMAAVSEDKDDISTEAEVFSMTIEPLFYKLLSFGMLTRMFEYELGSDAGASLDSERKKKLNDLKDDAAKLFKRYSEKLLEQLNYETVPIKKLVTIQLESGLIISQKLLSSFTDFS